MSQEMRPSNIPSKLNKSYMVKNICNVKTSETEELYYVFYDAFPSILAAGIIGRIVGKRDQRDFKNRKIIRCPYCKKPLTDVAENAKVELHRNPIHNRIDCDSYPKCKTCKNEVGMIVRKIN